MRLQFDEAEYNLRPCPFQVARPLDIGFLIEAGLELDQRGDRFSGFGGFGQRATIGLSLEVR